MLFIHTNNISIRNIKYQWKTYLYLGLLGRERGAWAGPGTDNLPAGGCIGPPAEAAQIAGFAPMAFCPLFACGENTILHQKNFFLHQTGHDGLSRFCTKIS